MNTKTCLHFSGLPPSMRVVYTLTLMVLGIGYTFAMIHIFASHAGRDGDAMLSVNDLIIAYSGSKGDTRLEAALKGPMEGMLPAAERTEIVAWVRRGAEREDFEKNIAPVIDTRCVMCHDGSNPHVPNLKGYDRITELVQRDTGMDIFTLVRVSHIHLFGITFIFYIVSMIFCHAEVRPLWLKCAIIAVPFFAIVADIGSWYLTKLWPAFGWVVMISGVLMGVSFAIEWVVSIYQMWFYKAKPELTERPGVFVEQ